MPGEEVPKGPCPIRLPTSTRLRPALALGAAQADSQQPDHRQPTGLGLGPPCPALRANRFRKDQVTVDCFLGSPMPRSPKPPPPHPCGLFCKLTNAYCFLGDGLPSNYYREIESNLQDRIPIFKATISNSSFVGPLCVGNRNGLILSYNTTDQEFRHIRNCVPDQVVVERLEERPFDLGRFIACNDHFALVSADLSRETVEIVEDVLCVDTIEHTVCGSNLVGSFSVFNNAGGLVHHLASNEEMGDLYRLFQLPLAAGTVNCGCDDIVSNMVVNDWVAFYGPNTTARELSVIESVFKLREP